MGSLGEEEDSLSIDGLSSTGNSISTEEIVFGHLSRK
jgi:hypothetical protein